MKLAIMQPYLFPYIGYFQLMNACDHFVVYDDVQFIKSGWINRNRMLSNGQPCYFNFRLKGSSTFDKIQEKMFIDQIDRDKEKFLKSLQGMYGKAPYFAETYQLIRRIIEVDEPRVSCFVAHTLEELADHFGMDITFHRSSDMDIPADIHGQERVLWINKHLGSAEYINVAGGLELSEPAADLALCIAVASSLKDEPVGQQVAVMGEVGLAGEVRGIPQCDRRVAECQRLGFTTIVLPKANLARLRQPEGVRLIGVDTVMQAISVLF